MRPETPDLHVEDDGDGNDRLGLEIAAAGDPHIEPLPEHVAAVRSALLAQLSPCLPAPHRWRWTSRLLAGSGLAAAAALALVMSLVNHPAIAWAQVAEALQRKTWSHGKVNGMDGSLLFEEWLSGARDLSALRGGPTVEFHDHKRKTLTRYVAAERTIYRLPEPPPAAAGDDDFLRVVLDLLSDPKGPPRFPFPNQELIGQDKHEVTEGGKTWLEITLTLRVAGGSRGNPETVQIRVDPKTKLPASLAMVDENGMRYTAVIDYPETGPTDIYALGAPRDAKVVERVVPDDVAQVTAALKAGRREFDDYCAFVVEHQVKPTYYYPRKTVYRVWRKGPKWRIERLRPPFLEWEPPAEAESLAWWKEHQNEYTFVPTIIGTGKEYWDYHLADSWQPGTPVPKVGQPEPNGQTIGPNALLGPADDPSVSFWCLELMPEQAAHPSEHLWDTEPSCVLEVDKNAAGGPPGTILFRGRDASPKGADRPDYFRYWLDPAANYLTMRHELRLAEPKNPDKIAWVATRVVESHAKSPKGYAYPTKTRWTGYKGDHEVTRSLYVDFEATPPDALFVPLK